MVENQPNQNSPDNTAAEQQNQEQFVIQKIYLKDCSFETPNSPDIFMSQAQPQPHIDISHHVQELQSTIYEVVVEITASVKFGEKTAFLAEVKQAGVFTLSTPKEQIPYMLNGVCPNIIFPYAREMISNLVSHGGFPPLLLNPVNFEWAFMQRMQQKQQQKAAKAAEEQSSPIN